MDHKERCKQLKQMRKEMADKIGLDLHQTECTYAGECSGTCPKCQQEEKKLNKALLSGAIALAGVALTACGAPGNIQVSEGESNRNESASNRERSRSGRDDDRPFFWENLLGQGKEEEVEPLSGDVEYDPGSDYEGGLEYDPEWDANNGGDNCDPGYELAGDVTYVEEPISEDLILEACENYSGAPIVEVDYYDGDYVVVHCYENVEDEDGDVTSYTWDSIEVNYYGGTALSIDGTTFSIYDYLDE